MQKELLSILSFVEQIRCKAKSLFNAKAYWLNGFSLRALLSFFECSVV